MIRLAGPALPYDRNYHLLARFDKIRSRVRVEKPDVLEAHSPYLGIAAALVSGRGAARVRTAFWHSDHLSTYVVPALEKVAGHSVAEAVASRAWRGIRALLQPFDATFVANRKQSELLGAAGVRRVECIPFGVDTATFHPTARSDARRRELLDGAPSSTVLLVGAGRLAVDKRWDVVLEAFGRVRAPDGREAVLVLFGDGPERRRLERIAVPGVRFVGFEPDAARFASALASADVLVHGCPYETFGLVVAEAVASGLPVVVPDAGGAFEGADPSCSECYASLEPRACAAAIERILARDRRGVRRHALDAAARVPTARAQGERVLSTYAELLRDKERKEGPVARPRVDSRRLPVVGR